MLSVLCQFARPPSIQTTISSTITSQPPLISSPSSSSSSDSVNDHTSLIPSSLVTTRPRAPSIACEIVCVFAGDPPPSIHALNSTTSTSTTTTTDPQPSTTTTSSSYPTSSIILQDLSTRPNLSLSHCLYRGRGYPEPTAWIIIANDNPGCRTVINHTTLPELTAEEFDNKVLEGGVVKSCLDGDNGRESLWFHFEGRNVAEVEKMVDRLIALRNEVHGQSHSQSGAGNGPEQWVPVKGNGWWGGKGSAYFEDWGAPVSASDLPIPSLSNLGLGVSSGVVSSTATGGGVSNTGINNVLGQHPSVAVSSPVTQTTVTILPGTNGTAPSGGTNSAVVGGSGGEVFRGRSPTWSDPPGSEVSRGSSGPPGILASGAERRRPSNSAANTGGDGNGGDTAAVSPNVSTAGVTATASTLLARSGSTGSSHGGVGSGIGGGASLPRFTISVEFEKTNRPGLENLLPKADVLFFSKIYVEGRGFPGAPTGFLDNVRRQCKPGAILFVTWGELGAFVLVNDPSRPARTFHAPAPSIYPVDTIGAGDTFIAGVIHALGARGCDARSAALWACRLATAKCAQDGFEGLAER
ncbi:hypothetical protein HDU76_012733 [Blyttiomyces sp. JEL0837]|nr:hypothetical protein HDU76_012733 [Blyttiomyces sp. JEL0837]